MSSEMISSSRNLVKNNNKESSDIFIRKPNRVPETCPIEVQRQRLPLIQQKKIQKKQKLKSKTSSLSLSSSVILQSWLKPGVSLPKLTTKASQEKAEITEPLHDQTLYSSEFLKLYSSSIKKDSSALPYTTSLRSSKCNHQGDEEGSEYYADAVGPSKCQFLFPPVPSESELENFKTPEADYEPSHALEQWDLWLKRNKRMQNFLSKKLSRKPCDLLMNQAENFRKKVEDKAILVYSKIPEPDKWRGHPYWWKNKPKLGGKKRDYIDCPQICPEYYSQINKIDQGIIPEMEFIGVPNLIQIEKELVCLEDPISINSTTKFWENMPYRREQVKYYKKERKKLKPHDIIMDELAVVGKKLKPTNENDSAVSLVNSEIPKISVNLTELGEKECAGFHTSRPHQRQWTSTIWLVINDEEIKFELGPNCKHNLAKATDEEVWIVEFGANAVGLTVEKSLRVENKGTMAIAYEWIKKKIEPQQSLNQVQPKRRESWFFFNKNSGIFVPGQIYDLKFYHRSNKAGVRTETWYLSTTPNIFNNPKGASIILTAVATDESVGKSMRYFESYLEGRVGESIVRTTLNSIIFKATQPAFDLTGIEYRSFFLEKELFEYHNPKHYYHSEVVQDLKNLLQEIGSQQEEWDMSLDSLVMLAKSYAKEDTKDQFLCRIAGCSKELLRPNYFSGIRNKKYWMVYQVLCKMTNYLEEDHNYLRCCLSQKRLYFKEKSLSEYEDSEEYLSTKSEEGEGTQFSFEGDLYYISPINFIYFQTMFYLKVYQRLCEATENIFGIVESCKTSEAGKVYIDKTRNSINE